MNPFTFYCGKFYAKFLPESIYIDITNLLLYLNIGFSPYKKFYWELRKKSKLII